MEIPSSTPRIGRSRRSLSIDVTANDDAATARVSFQNFGEAKRVVLELARTPAGWRIAEIRAPSGSLKALYKLA